MSKAVHYPANAYSDEEGYRIHCPGCKCSHRIPVVNPHGHAWKFNGNVDSPTFTPSLHIKTGHYCEGQPSAENCQWCAEDRREGSRSMCTVCHSFITDGKIQFLNDCTHELAGQTVDLSELELI